MDFLGADWSEVNQNAGGGLVAADASPPPDMQAQYEAQMVWMGAELQQVRAQLLQCESGKQELLRQVAAYRALLDRYCIPSAEVEAIAHSYQEAELAQGYGLPGSMWLGSESFSGAALESLVAADAGEQALQGTSLDSKMQKLNLLLQDGEGPDPKQPGASGREDLDGGIDQQLRALEDACGSQVDDRALEGLKGIAIDEAATALRHVQEIMVAQGGSCRNLSALIQSHCRKVMKRKKAGGEE
eukprot:TRINITY_DN43973_c0_g1_i1.p1 TRINITY_DN43973_c0_g1~~TRINITY_DN43973_c0_g1_i1.p1  ORF type:complete len:255 (+),score=66.05 TRINITY_DN43973_c0_g1_i1:37-765(+)